MLLKIAFVLLCVCMQMVNNSNAQIGLFALDNSDLEIAHLNPAKIAMADLPWNVNVGGGHFMIHTNYAYLSDESLLRQGLAFSKPGPYTEKLNNHLIPKVRYYDSSRPTFGKAAGALSGPSFSIKVANWHIGFISGLHFSSSASSIPVPLGYWNNYEIPGGVVYELDKGHASGLLWSSLGLHISNSFAIGHRGQFYWGVNLKRLNSFYAIGVENHGIASVRKTGRGEVSAVSGSGEILLSDSWQLGRPFSLGNTGSGYGLDMGFIVRSRTRYHHMPFEWGVSLNGLGSIKLDDKYTNAASIRVDKEVVFSTTDFGEVGYHPTTSFNIFNELISAENNQVELNTSSNFYTPAQITAYVKTPIARNLNGQIIWQQNLSTQYRMPASFNHFSLAASYSYKQLGISIPLSWVDYHHVWTGLAIRIGPLTVGTDRINGSLFTTKRLDGASIYASVKFNSQTFPFRGGWWSKKKERCPEFK